MLQAAFLRGAWCFQLPVDRLCDGAQPRALHFCREQIGEVVIDPGEGGYVIARLEEERRLLFGSAKPTKKVQPVPPLILEQKESGPPAAVRQNPPADEPVALRRQVRSRQRLADATGQPLHEMRLLL